MMKVTGKILLSVGLLSLVPSVALPQQHADPDFEPDVSAPAFVAGTGPTVAIDEGHKNFHTMGGRFRSHFTC